MTRCLDEAKLQSYFDGELSIETMKSLTSHLAACVICAAAARELEEESALLTAALAAEFEVSVPTERLRERIDAAVFGERLATAQSTQKGSGLAGFFSSLLNFGTQRTFGYASLVVVLAFAAIFGVVTMRNKMQAPASKDQNVATAQPSKVEEAPPTKAEEVQTSTPSSAQPTEVAIRTQPSSGVTFRPVKASTTANRKSEPVKLLPGERAYLQAIARLDSTIKENKKTMRPSLQVEYERNLAVVDRAIAATRTAAKSNPNDPDAADFMFAAYQSKVDLLNTIADARLSGGRGH